MLVNHGMDGMMEKRKCVRNECWVHIVPPVAMRAMYDGETLRHGLPSVSITTLTQVPGVPHGHPHGQQLGQLAQPQVPHASYHVNYGGQPVAAVAPQQRFVPQRDERVDTNPGGRVKTQPTAAKGMMGSMESLQSQDSVFSFGSTISSNGKKHLKSPL